MTLPQARYCRSLKEAQEEDPEGVMCTYCGKETDFWDDLGFFYLNPGGDLPSGASCEACYWGTPGQMHIARYGVGER